MLTLSARLELFKMAPRQVQRKAASSQADTIVCSLPYLKTKTYLHHLQPVVPRNRNKRKADDLDDEQPSKALKHSDGNVQSKRTVTPKPSDDGTVKPKAARQRKPRARKGAADFKGQKKLSEFFTRTPPATPPPKRVDHDGDVSMTDAPAIDEATLVEEIEAVSPPGTDIPGDQYEGSETGAVPFEEGIDEVKDVTEDVEGLVLEMR